MMKIPSRLSGKWFLTYLLSSLTLVIIVFSSAWAMVYFQSGNYNVPLLCIVIIPILFINLVLTIMGFFGWLYMWSFSVLGLIASSFISGVVLIEEKSGWELFVALYLMVLLVGISGVLGSILQVIHYVKNRKNDINEIEYLSSNGKKIIAIYALLLVASVLYLLLGI